MVISENRSAVIQAAHDRFFNAPTREEAQEALSPLTPHERLRFTASPAFPKCLNQNQPVANFRLDDENETTQSDMESLYRNAFHIIGRAAQLAKESGKPLRIFVGEMHSDRTALALTVMLFMIAPRLGIENFAIERPNEAYQIEMGDKRAIMLGLKEIQEEADSLERGNSSRKR